MEPAGKGHRERLRNRFLKSGGNGLMEYEYLELLLTYAIPRRDVKPLARDLLGRFGSIQEILEASEQELLSVAGTGETTLCLLKLVRELAVIMARRKIEKRPVLESVPQILRYARLEIGYEKHEKFMVIYLNIRNEVIGSEIIASGTVNHLSVYPRELILNALNRGACGMILIHNHPGGSLEPSPEDVSMTDTLRKIGLQLQLALVDHIIVTSSGACSILGYSMTGDGELLSAASEKKTLRKEGASLPFDPTNLRDLRKKLVQAIIKESDGWK